MKKGEAVAMSAMFNALLGFTMYLFKDSLMMAGVIIMTGLFYNLILYYMMEDGN